MLWGLIFILLLCILIVLFIKHLWIIPTKYFAIVERLGTFNRILKPGMHILSPFIDNLKYIEWKWENKTVKGYLFNMDKRQMDIKPVSCITKDRLPITLDTTLFYMITKPEIAVYKSDDVLNLFYQTSVQCIRNVLNKVDGSQLTSGQDIVVSTLIKDSINQKLQDEGIVCVDILFQSLSRNTNTNVENNNTNIMPLDQVNMEIVIFKMRKEAGIPTPQEIEMEKAKSLKFYWSKKPTSAEISSL